MEEAGITATTLQHKCVLTFAFDDQQLPWEVHGECLVYALRLASTTAVGCGAVPVACMHLCLGMGMGFPARCRMDGSYQTVLCMRDGGCFLPLCLRQCVLFVASQLVCTTYPLVAAAKWSPATCAALPSILCM